MCHEIVDISFFSFFFFWFNFTEAIAKPCFVKMRQYVGKKN